MKKYLVLGGNGFIGKCITKSLALEDEVIVADHNIDHCDEISNVTYKKIDFARCDNFTELLDGVDTVIHLISTIGPNDRLNNINQEISDNVFPTIKLLNNMVELKTKKIVFVSSGGTVYGEHSNEPILEEEIKRPICNYGILKDLIEKYLQLYHFYYQLDYRVIRLANPYSEVTKHGKSQGIIPIFTDHLLNDEPIYIWGDGNDVRDYIYIDDAISAILKIMQYEGEEKIFNVGTGKGYTVNQVLSIISENLDISAPKVCYQESRKCDVKNNVLSVDKVSSLVGWYPETSLEDGIQKIIRKKVKGDYYHDKKNV